MYKRSRSSYLLQPNDNLYILTTCVGLGARKPVFGMCEQQRRRPACASAQSDQRLCYSLSGKYSSQPCCVQNF